MAAKFSGASPAMVQMPAKMPWRWAFWAEIFLPSGVTGPRDLAPLAREAAIWAAERGLGFGVVVWVGVSVGVSVVVCIAVRL
jgi:hypothetical protein